MIRFFCIFLCFFSFIFAAELGTIANAPQVDNSRVGFNPNKNGWEVDLYRLAINSSVTQINNQQYYTNFPDARLKGTSQLFVEGFLDFWVNYYRPKFVFFNNLNSEYGKLIYKPLNMPSYMNKTIDTILLSSDFTYRLFRIKHIGEVGPFLQIAYQTEFEPAEGMKRRHIAREIAGLKIFNGKFVRDIHFAGFNENDLAGESKYHAAGYQAVAKLHFDINKSTRFYIYSNYRRYLYNALDNAYRPYTQLEVEARLDTELWGRLSMAPFVKYYEILGENLVRKGTNLFAGISIAFGHTFVEANAPKSTPANRVIRSRKR